MYTPLREKYLKELKAMACKFEDNSGKIIPEGFCYQAYFINGYGISIIKHDDSYGRADNKWEIAVLKGDELCYDTPITDDVIGWLTGPEVLDYACKIAALPAVDRLTDEEAKLLSEGLFEHESYIVSEPWDV